MRADAREGPGRAGTGRIQRANARAKRARGSPKLSPRSTINEGTAMAANPPHPPHPPLCGIGSDSGLTRLGADGGSIITATKKAAPALLGLDEERQRAAVDLDLARLDLDRTCEHTGRADDT